MSLSPVEQRKRELRERLEGVRDLAIGCLKKRKTGCKEGKGRKTTLRVIELSPCSPTPAFHLESVVVEEHEV